MEILFLFFAIMIFIMILLKYGSIGIMYTLIFLLPFRFEIISINNIGIRLPDLFSFLYIIFWLIQLFLGNIKKNDTKVLKKILFFVAFVVFSFFVNFLRFNITGNIIDLIRFLLAVFAGIAISTTIKTKDNIIRLFIIWIISASLSSLISLCLFFINGYKLSTLFNLNSLSVVDFYQMKFSNSIFFEDPNNLATYLVISIFITIGLIAAKKISNKYIYILLFLQFSGLVLTLSRSAYFAMFLAIIIYIFIFKKSYKWNLSKTLIMLALISQTNNLFQYINSDTSIMSRLDLWKVGINMTISNFLVGVGIGNSSLFFSEYVTSPLIIYNPHFHNLFLTISSEFGLLGLLLFVMIIVDQILDLKYYQDKLYIFLVFGLIAYLIQSMGVEYFSSRHVWIFIPLIIQYKSFFIKGGKNDGFSISANACL